MALKRRHWKSTGGMLAVWLILAAAAWGQTLPEVVATVAGEPIRATQLEEAALAELRRLELERYRILKEKLDELIAARLMQLEAARRGVSVAQLQEEEVANKVAPVTEAQVRQFYETHKERLQQPFEALAPRIRAYLQQQAREARQRIWLRSLRERYAVHVALAPPTVNVSVDDDPALGPAEAPVTIVEFSDFQCPYCRRVQPTLKRLLREYDGKVRLVYRDFPLRNIHPQAQKAAEAAQCAAEQRQFWPYHDRLFAADRLEVADLKQYAAELGLDVQQFATCLDSGKYAAEVEKDLQDGVRAGVSATPSFFINGQPLTGAVPYERFQELVEEALARAGNARRATP
ncbi:MAG: hypothetical protein KatS3mg131_0520 [Candidatus Tectimicrobiota bacterium]|nr:MAG: hypothetical protein KatS3mg131_0520 [Candidatus Tectomicrobia bacterium]